MFEDTEGDPNVLTSAWVLAVMMKLSPHTPWVFTYGETAEAIAIASNSDPLFKGEEGPKKTAALLIALAKFESEFNPNIVGDHGHSFGLFQIQPPTAKVESNLLTQPRIASAIAIDLIRTSFQTCRSEQQGRWLAWYAAGHNGCLSAGFAKSEHRMSLAKRLLKENP